MKILCDENNFIISACTDDNILTPSAGQTLHTISNNYMNIQLYELNFAYPLYKYINGQVTQITQTSEYSTNQNFLNKVFKKLRVDNHDIVEASVLPEYVDNDTIKLTSGFVGVRSIILSSNVDILLSFIGGTIESGVTKKPNTWYYVYSLLDLMNPTQFKGIISETPPSKDRFGNTVSSDRNGERYHPTLDARFRGSFKTDNDNNIIPHNRVGNKISYMNTNNYIGQGIVSQNGSLINCRQFIPITSNIGQFMVESSGKFNSKIYQELGSSINNYIFRVRRGNSGVSDIVIENDSISFKTQSVSIDISVIGYYEEV